jgi:hypothetical protein
MCPCPPDCLHRLWTVLLAAFGSSCLSCLIFQIFHICLLSDQNCLHHPLVFENEIRFQVLDVHQNVSFQSCFDLNGVVRFQFDNLEGSIPLTIDSDFFSSKPTVLVWIYEQLIILIDFESCHTTWQVVCSIWYFSATGDSPRCFFSQFPWLKAGGLACCPKMMKCGEVSNVLFKEVF